MYNLPTVVPFLEMYNVGNIEQLNILEKQPYKLGTTVNFIWLWMNRLRKL